MGASRTSAVRHGHCWVDPALLASADVQASVMRGKRGMPLGPGREDRGEGRGGTDVLLGVCGVFRTRSCRGCREAHRLVHSRQCRCRH